ncbi:sigma 54 modulation/S30EA ribosomal C-terminal domain-containing protein [Nocardia nova]|nr:sigma 54 modulation/S30EA ribosomal C-terminal domain-containing protein [Nocardia nova]
MPAVDIRLGGGVPSMFGEYARQRIRRVVEGALLPVSSISVRLASHYDSAVANPFVAQANITATRPVRVQAAGASAREAVDLLQSRVRVRLRALAGRRALHGTSCRPAGTLLYLRPTWERTVVRTKTFHLDTQTCDMAAREMSMMDYSFRLFIESGTGAESVLHRTAHGDYRLLRTAGRPRAVAPGCLPLVIAERPVPELDRDEALNRLALSASPFLFYRDPALDRGCVVYHRYDGHYAFMTSRR